MKGVLRDCHPAVTALYFVLVIACAMLLLHPVCLLFSLLGAAGYAVRLTGRRAGRVLLYTLPMALLAAVINPLFNHRGQTTLTYLPSGNPLTAESLAYGAAAGVLLAAGLLWFYCMSKVMTGDDFVYLFGKVIPSAALVLSMALAFVPRFQRRLHATWQAQQSTGQTANGLRQKIKRGAAALSIVVTWSLENGAQTADGMRSRGYGLPHRTRFAVRCWTGRDSLLLGILAVLAAVLFICVAGGAFQTTYFPSLLFASGVGTGIAATAYAALCALPLLLDLTQQRRFARAEKGGESV